MSKINPTSAAENTVMAKAEPAGNIISKELARKPAAAKATVTKTVAAKATTTKPATKPAAPTKPVATSPVKTQAKSSVKEKTAKPAKEKLAKEKPVKLKMERDSFTMPKIEYAQFNILKARLEKLGQPAKKSELLRAGIMLLAAMTDAALKTTMSKVPTIKTGRPKKK